MRNVLKKTLIGLGFAAGALGLIFLVSVLFFQGKDAHANGVYDPSIAGAFEEPENTIDVLIVGDSETYSSLIPLQMFEEHGITSYCCATSGQLLSDSEEILRRIFESQSPKIVILETNAIFRKVSTSNVFIRKLGDVFSVFTNHDRWKEIGGSNHSEEDSKRCDTKGYRFSTEVAPVFESGKSQKQALSDRIARQTLFFLDQIKSVCNEKGAQLLLVSTPSVLNWNEKKHDRLERLSAELDVTYIDMNLLNEEVPIDWQTDTRDHGDHLNYFGAKKATAYLGAWLSNCGLLTDHREDETYVSWKKEVETFRAMITADPTPEGLNH